MVEGFYSAGARGALKAQSSFVTHLLKTTVVSPSLKAHLEIIQKKL